MVSDAFYRGFVLELEKTAINADLKSGLIQGAASVGGSLAAQKLLAPGPSRSTTKRRRQEEERQSKPQFTYHIPSALV